MKRFLCLVLALLLTAGQMIALASEDIVLLPENADFLSGVTVKDGVTAYGKGDYVGFKGVDLTGSNLGGWPLKTVALSYGSKKVWAYANYHGNNAESQTLNIPSGTWTDILSGKSVEAGSYTLLSGQALVLVNSSVVK